MVCAGGRATRFDVPAGLEAVLVVPHRHVRTAKARAAMPAQVPLADAVHNVGRASQLVLGLAQGDWELVADGLHDRLHQPRRASLYPQSMALLRRARELGALGATISGAGPTRARVDALRGHGRRRAAAEAGHGGLGAGHARPVRAPGGRRQGAVISG